MAGQYNKTSSGGMWAVARYLRVAVWALLFSTVSAHADELAELKERNARLAATVEELTLQLAESLKAQRQLETALAAAQKAAVTPTSTLKTEHLSSGQSSDELSTSTLNKTAQATDSAAAESVSSLDSPDCKVSAIMNGYRGTGEQNKEARAWLGSNDHLKQCSSDQLLAIRKTIRWDFWGYSREAIAMIDRELEKR